MPQKYPSFWLFGLITCYSVGVAAAQTPALSVQLVKTFSYTASPYTLQNVGGINNHGNIACVLYDSIGKTESGSVFHAARNAFSPPFNDPDQTGFFTYPTGINDMLVLCGAYDTSDGHQHGFLENMGVFMTYDAPVEGVTFTNINGENNAGDFAGTYFSTTTGGGFTVISGQFASIEIVEADVSRLNAINNLDMAVGDYVPSGGLTYHGLVRNADGTLTYPVDYPGADSTFMQGINDAGLIVGYWTQGRDTHGFLLQLPDTFVSFDVPPSKGKGTFLAGINNLGVISGSYTGRDRQGFGLIARVLSQ